MPRMITTVVALALMLAGSVSAQEYGVEVLNAAPSAEGASAGIIERLAGQGYKITRDSKQTVCEIWLGKQLEIEAGFEKSDARLYPFKPRQLIGLIHIPRRTSEFRNQEVQSGWYTLRFELQPVDGNHVGTSATRDFLLMVPAGKDQPNKSWDAKELIAASSEVVGASHPAMICLQPVDKSADKKPTIRHDEEKDWWIARIIGKGIADGKPQDIVLDLVVAGHAAE